MNKKTRVAVEVGAGVAAAAALAGATYWFYASKDAKKHRKAASKWAVGLQKQVVKEAKKLKKIDAKSVAKLVDNAASAYDTVKSIDRADLKAAVKELKSNWKLVGGNMTGVAKKAVKKSAKKRI